MSATMKADNDVLGILRNSSLDDDGITLIGELDRAMYIKVNKFLEVSGAKWNKGKKKHVFQNENSKSKILGLINNGEVLNEKKHYQAFYTPKFLANEIVELAGIKQGDTVLEPSAGEGAIALKAKNKGAAVTCIEINSDAVKVLERLGFDTVQRADFLKIDPSPSFDFVLMNPPFTKNQDIDHILHACGFLKSGGKLIAITSLSWFSGSQKKQKEFCDFVNKRGRVIRKTSLGDFKESGTNIETLIIEIIKEQT